MGTIPVDAAPANASASACGVRDRSETPLQVRLGEVREQAVLFNAATTITVVLGVLVLYAALFAGALAGEWLVLANGPLAKTLGHPPKPSDYLRLAWLVSSLSMVGGALGGGLESDETVRHAAYGYRPDPDADQALRYASADEAE
jgi:hypothetical protein